MRPRVDLTAAAKLAARNSSLRWDSLVQEWVKNRIQNTPTPSPDDYKVTYVNAGFRYTISVDRLHELDIREGRPNPELLLMNLNSMPRQNVKLRHYHYDTWTFMSDSRDDAVRKGMTGFLKLPRLLVEFVRDDSSQVVAIDWDLQAGSCEGPAPELGRCVPPIRFKKPA